jgi:predicted GIY-YIG superfamily endonuclease
MGYCYLAHFVEKYRHAGHYLGFTTNLKQRLHQHKAGSGARLMTVIAEAHIDFVVARVWPDCTREDERMLKLQHNGRKLCPICKQVPFLEAIGYDLFTSPLE